MVHNEIVENIKVENDSKQNSCESKIEKQFIR